MILEAKFAAWLRAGLALYAANPLLVESVFYDASQVGWPTLRDNGIFRDDEKLWIADEFAGGILRWAGQTFPIVSNTMNVLSITGDPSLFDPTDVDCYQIVPPGVAGLTTFLQQEKFAVSTVFAQVPTAMPAFTLRLERDTQADTYIGEDLHRYVIEGAEFAVRQQSMTAAYLCSIWTENRDATIWLYAWLLHYGLISLPQFTTWGLYDVQFTGSDLDPALQYLAERTYNRHLLITVTRMERAVEWVRYPVEYVDRVCVRACAAYAELAADLPQPLP